MTSSCTRTMANCKAKYCASSFSLFCFKNKNDKSNAPLVRKVLSCYRSKTTLKVHCLGEECCRLRYCLTLKRLLRVTNKYNLVMTFLFVVFVAECLRFKSRVGQIENRVASGSPPLQHFLVNSYGVRMQ